MHRLLLCFAILPLTVTGAPRVASEDRAISLSVSPVCCSITFTAWAFGILPIEGRFGAFEGRLFHDPASPASAYAQASIMAASLMLDGGPIEADVKAAHFLDVAHFPLIEFTSAPQGLAGDATLQGSLTIKGVTNQVTLALRHNDDSVTAEALISRRRFGITSRPLLAGDTIAIRITAPLRP